LQQPTKATKERRKQNQTYRAHERAGPVEEVFGLGPGAAVLWRILLHVLHLLFLLKSKTKKKNCRGCVSISFERVLSFACCYLAAAATAAAAAATAAVNNVSLTL
jgi:hypothetical protein